MQEYIHLEGGAVSLVLAVGEPGVPVIHWGPGLTAQLPPAAALRPAAPHASFDEPILLGLVPSAARSWRGRPALRGVRADGTGFSPCFELDSFTTTRAEAQLELIDRSAQLRITAELHLDDSGVLIMRFRLKNEGVQTYRLHGLDLMLPVPERATELMDFTGRWAKEGQPQRHAMHDGTWVRSGRHGRTGHDQSLLLAAGTAGFGFETGEVWAVHLGWSGDHERFLDRSPQPQSVLGAGELLHAGEIELGSGEEYSTPAAYFVYSERGLNGVSQAFHRHLRSRPQHPRTPRPVVLNSWEAIYFEHSFASLRELIEDAARIGVERFVLDDGWFKGRRDDWSALGDWTVDPEVWGDDFERMIELVHQRGMQFGLWVEPEMISLDSDLARAHPQWLLRADQERLPPLWRHQHGIDLVHPEAWQHVHDTISGLLKRYAIDYLKWDFNRDNLEQGHLGRASAHRQTQALYRMLDELRRAHPGVEIESCASGGARIDLGVLERSDRVWISDTNDALERQTIQRSYSLLLPPELQGTHVGPEQSHTTGRRHTLSFRAATALFGHFGIEADLSEMGQERAELAEAIALYKEHRSLLHTGRWIESDTAQPGLRVHGVISEDGAEALFAVVALDTLRSEQPGPVRLPGLLDERSYSVRVLFPSDTETTLENSPPGWFDEGVLAGGDLLRHRGLAMPVLLPEHALILHCRIQPPAPPQ